ncbi:MAG: hypothetical protein CM15mP22_1790 [Gammaproteobacteria bacterium]|nr:MAG: hypothetical protein CM15mP22_1790 [Gammaproteobacteria bacterium]
MNPVSLDESGVRKILLKKKFKKFLKTNLELKVNPKLWGS